MSDYASAFRVLRAVHACSNPPTSSRGRHCRLPSLTGKETEARGGQVIEPSLPLCCPERPPRPPALPLLAQRGGRKGRDLSRSPPTSYLLEAKRTTRNPGLSSAPFRAIGSARKGRGVPRSSPSDRATITMALARRGACRALWSHAVPPRDRPRPGKRGRLPPRLTDEETGGPERLPRQSTVTQRVDGRTRTGHGLQARPPASCHSVTRENEDAVPQATPVTEAGQKCTLLEPRASDQRHLLLTSPGLASPTWALVGQ